MPFLKGKREKIQSDVKITRRISRTYKQNSKKTFTTYMKKGLKKVIEIRFISF